MSFRFKTFICLALLTAAAMVYGQGVTTASFSGTVSDNQGSPLPGAVVTTVHEPTGTRYSTVSRANGTWRILNVRVGGPYSATASMTGFRTQKEENIFVKLGEDFVLNFKLQIDTVEEELVVTADSNPLINPARTGSTTNVGEQAIESLPSISRSIEDFARTNPYFSTSSSDDGATTLTVAGQNNRYNNIQIDGAVNNDLFGLSPSGSPGGQAESPFISLDAIKEVQLLVAPFDVRQGGFSGGGVNAVTRSGSNTFEGSIFHFFRTDSMIGDGPNNIPLGEFDEKQTGFRVGGPILKDRVFFFANAEQRRKAQPNGWASRAATFDDDGNILQDSAGTGQNFGHFEEAQEFIQIARDVYGYDPGGVDDVTRDTDSDSIFVRFDFNIADNHQLTLRHNYVDATNLRTGNSNFTFQFPGNHQFFPSETNSTVLQLNSSWGDYFNEFRLSYQTVRDRRGGVGQPFPWVEIENLDRNFGGSGEFEAGTERFSTANSLDQDVLEITNDLTFFVGNHTITIGTHNEIFAFDNLFIRENFGAYEFRDLEAFRNGWVRRFNYSFSADPNDPLRSAKFDVQQFGLYAGDQWAATSDLNFTFGLRVDVPFFPDTPTRNPISEDVFGFRTDVTADGNALWSPRAGFNWDINGDATNQLRGGFGWFTGKAPYVWLSNQYSNTGIEFERISVTTAGTEADHIDFVPDPFNQPTDFPLQSSSGNEIDLIEPGFELPQLLRFNLAYDRDLGFWGIIGSVEAIYSENVNDILYSNLNWTPSGETLFDGRPIFTQVDRDFRDIILLSNTSQGSTLNTSIKFERPFKDGLYWSTSYTYGDAESINDGTSSQARSNWRFNPTTGDPNEPPLGRSLYEVKHRINAAVSYQFGFSRAPTTVSMFYNAQSGRPFSTTFRNDVNGDGEDNDLLYVPASADEVVMVGGTWEEFNAYINADNGLRAARGGIVERNGSNAPWRRTLDFRLSQDVKISTYKFQVSLDILNFMNLLDSKQGEIKYVGFNEISPIRYDGIDEATGKPIYNLQFSDPDRRFTTDNLRSRYQMQLGARFTF